MSIDYTLTIVMLGTAILGFVSGVLGSFAVLRKQSLLGDAMAHASLPGIAIFYLLSGQTNTPFLLLGAMIAGWIGTGLVMIIIGETKLKEDAALGIILSVFFGFGLVLLTIIQRKPGASQIGVDQYLFGNAATLLLEDIIVMGGFGIISLVIISIFWKEFKVLSFDPDYLKSLGYPTKKIELLLTSTIVVAIVIGLQTVGVVLMSAMVISPAAAARQWTDKLVVMVILAGTFGTVSGVSGALLSSYITNLPTGPTIVCIMSVIVLISLLLAPNRGGIWGYYVKKSIDKQIREDTMLENLLMFSESKEHPFYPHDIAALTAIGRGPAKKALESLKEKGFAQNPKGDMWAITEEGLKYAKKNKYLPEVYIEKKG